MNQRLVTVVVGLIAAIFVIAALGFAWLVELRMPHPVGRPVASVIPHPAGALRSADCTSCHSVENGRLPLTHRSFPDDTCLSCHDWRPLPYVPHSISMGDRECLLCHGDPTQDLGMPKDHLAYPDKRCSFCHEPDPEKVSVLPEPAGESAGVKPEITHPIAGPFKECLYCHRIGGTPPMPESHALFDQDSCDICHEISERAASVFR